VLALFVAWLAVFVVLVRGIKSFGKAVYFTSTFPYIILTALLINAVIRDGAVDGIIFYITPQWHRLADPKVWSAAAGQVMTELSPFPLLRSSSRLACVKVEQSHWRPTTVSITISTATL
jgi:solute carrier family 6 amino acid transporter-like protein 5/7/9/14